MKARGVSVIEVNFKRAVFLAATVLARVMGSVSGGMGERMQDSRPGPEVLERVSKCEIQDLTPALVARRASRLPFQGRQAIHYAANFLSKPSFIEVEVRVLHQ